MEFQEEWIWIIIIATDKKIKIGEKYVDTLYNFNYCIIYTIIDI